MDENKIPIPMSPPDIDEWKAKLIGKIYVQKGDMGTLTGTFSDDCLPPNNRVLAPDTPATRDYQTHRLNVILDENNTVTHVYYG